MLTLFPDILFLEPFASTLLRVAAGIIFLLAAWCHYERREEFGEITFMIVGKGIWVPIITAIFETLIGLGLIFGVYTQAVAILGALGAAKFFIWKRRYNSFIPISRTASALLFVICLSLIVSGAGAFAFDLPL